MALRPMLVILVSVTALTLLRNVGATSSYLSLTDDQLWAATTSGNTIGTCYISVATLYSSSVCDLYVKAQGKGWPTSPLGGSGCVKAPDWPRGVTTCWYADPVYSLPPAVISDFCTNVGKHNAVAQVRYGFKQGKCIDYSSMSNDDLWALTTGGNTIGTCYISVATSSSSAVCDLYVKAQGKGWPTSPAGGSGCVKAPDWPRRVSTCWYSDPVYGLPASLVATFCTNVGINNAIAQLRYALQKSACFSV